jgi:hypothetical protein
MIMVTKISSFSELENNKWEWKYISHHWPWFSLIKLVVHSIFFLTYSHSLLKITFPFTTGALTARDSSKVYTTSYSWFQWYTSITMSPCEFLYIIQLENCLKIVIIYSIDIVLIFCTTTFVKKCVWGKKLILVKS